MVGQRYREELGIVPSGPWGTTHPTRWVTFGPQTRAPGRGARLWGVVRSPLGLSSRPRLAVGSAAGRGILAPMCWTARRTPVITTSLEYAAVGARRVPTAAFRCPARGTCRTPVHCWRPQRRIPTGIEHVGP
jgi:hypothetical protein